MIDNSVTLLDHVVRLFVGSSVLLTVLACVTRVFHRKTLMVARVGNVAFGSLALMVTFAQIPNWNRPISLVTWGFVVASTACLAYLVVLARKGLNP